MSIASNPKTPTSLSIRIQYYDGSAWYDTTGEELRQLFNSADSDTYVPQFSTQYETPATGSTVQVTDGSDSIWLLLTPTNTLASLTIKLPSATNIVQDKQEISVTSTNLISSLTIDENGASNVFGAPSSIAQESHFTLRYDAQNNAWYRVAGNA